MKIPVSDGIEIKDGDLKRDAAFESEDRKATQEFSSPKVQKQIQELGEEAWNAGEAFRKGQYLRLKNLSELAENCESLFRKYITPEEDFRRAKQKRDSERETLAMPYKRNAIELLQDEEDHLMAKYSRSCHPSERHPPEESFPFEGSGMSLGVRVR